MKHSIDEIKTIMGSDKYKLAKQISSARIKSNLSREDVAKMFNSSAHEIAQIENFFVKIPIDRYLDLLNLLRPKHGKIDSTFETHSIFISDNNFFTQTKQTSLTEQSVSVATAFQSVIATDTLGVEPLHSMKSQHIHYDSKDYDYYVEPFNPNCDKTNVDFTKAVPAIIEVE